MGDKKKLIFFFYVITFFAISEEDEALKNKYENAFLLKKMKEKPLIHERYKIFYDSVAFNSKLLQIKSISGVNKIGSYVFEYERDLLTEFVPYLKQEQLLYTVKDYDQSIKFTDGKLLIKFHKKENMQEFARQHQLILTYEFSVIGVGVFKVEDFSNIQQTLNLMSSYKNISEIELNTLNPNIQKR
jgi:hypothetical protein|tara:strand:- start:1541 stop:2098 length:558 start_codon:yes stop_codon:yes gene_type:complete